MARSGGRQADRQIATRPGGWRLSLLMLSGRVSPAAIASAAVAAFHANYSAIYRGIEGMKAQERLTLLGSGRRPARA